MLTSRYTPPLIDSDQSSTRTLMRQTDRDQDSSRPIPTSAASVRSIRSRHSNGVRRVVRSGRTTRAIPEDSVSDHSFGMLSTQSLVGSLFDYPTENGRRYHSLDDDAYFMPNDEREADRLILTHQMHLVLMGARLFLAPLPPTLTHVLDVGTGTGDWAIDMAETFPRSEVIGIDLSAMQPAAVPANVFFEIENAEAEWEFSHPFDFIHIRNLSGALDNWPAMYARAFKFLKPGGYIEVIDHDRPIFSDVLDIPATKALIEAYAAACEASGRPWSTDHLSHSLFEEAGFVEIEEHVFHMPIGGASIQSQDNSWLAKLGLVTITDGIEAFVLRPLTKWGKLSVGEVNKLVEEVTQEFLKLSELSAEGNAPVRVVVAKKPL